MPSARPTGGKTSRDARTGDISIEFRDRNKSPEVFPLAERGGGRTFQKHCDHRSRAEFHHVKERRPEDGEARAEGLDDRGEDNQAVDFER